ncbi:MAG: two-component system response regulator [Deltaproteobacteria bacterium]|nr:two-component system response regulator [Deltaproteobacteria bacterium]
MEAQKKVLVVDDEDRNLRLMEAMLIPLGYEVGLAADGEAALTRVKDSPPDVILLDIMMPKMDGFEVARRIKSDEETRFIPIVMVTALKDVEDRVKALEAGADDFLTKPVDKVELRARVRSLLKVKAYNDHMRSYQQHLEQEVARRTEQLERAIKRINTASLETIFILSRAAEHKDEDTGSHIKRMANYSAAVARKMGLPDRTVEAILYAAPMHDVGKIGIPDNILLKPARLTYEECEIMKTHTTIGAHILTTSLQGFLQFGKVIAMTHHEKWDGGGYPLGLKGKKIPLAGRIVAIADVFDALTSKRPYKEAFPLEKSYGIIRESRGTHFDPDVVDAFFAIEEEILTIKNRYKDEEESIFLQTVRRSSSAGARPVTAEIGS